MGRSLGLALHLLMASGGSVPSDVGERPDGTVLWLHLSPDAQAGPVAQLARRISRETAPALILFSGPSAAEAAALVPGSRETRLRIERSGTVAAALMHWRPDVLVLIGDELPPTLIVAAHEAAIPVILADFALRRHDMLGWRLRRAMLGSLVERIARVIVRDHDSAERVIRLLGTGVAPVVAGPLEETAEPLPVSEAEREAMSRVIGTRPVWLAAGCTEAEEDTVIAAHAGAMRLAHRMLLILVPSDPSRGAALAERTGREGWVVALRSQDQDPETDVQVLIDDGEGEYGLWYRLAPFCFMGGTLSGGSTRSPMEAAALGSAILAGPAAGRFATAYARLSSARAFRALRTTSDLADGVADLIAADRTALLAHNAWAVSSAGVEATDRIAGSVAALLEDRRSAATGSAA